MNKVYLLIGGNMGDRLANIQSAQLLIAQNAGTIIETSSIYETEAWGLKEQPAFLNQALLIATELSAQDLLIELQAIEKALGRKRIQHLGPRTMDIDIIYFNDAIIHTKTLAIPHPHLHSRNFVLTPLVEIAPDYPHPQMGLTNRELLVQCPDNSTVYKKNDH